MKGKGDLDMKNALFILQMSLLVSCGTSHIMKSKFDKEKASAILSKGKNSISGNSLIRLNSGGVVTCAGLPVLLRPVTEYTQEYIQAIFGSTERGSKRNSNFNKVNFQELSPEMEAYTKISTCDSLGNFVFENISDGEYFLSTGISWMASPYVTENWSLMKKVQLKDGEVLKVSLTP